MRERARTNASFIAAKIDERVLRASFLARAEIAALF